jgi:hypothetical protein
MTKYLFILFVCLGHFSQAQKLRISIAGGLCNNKSIVRLYGNKQIETKDYESFYSYRIGIRITSNLNNHIDFQSGVFINEKGYKYYSKRYFGQSPYQFLESYTESQNEYIHNNHTYYLNYLDIPLIFSFNISKSLAINAGSGININLSYKKYHHESSFDIPIQSGITLKKKRMSFDIMASLGLIPYFTLYAEKQYGIKDNYEFFHRQISTTLGYMINQKVTGCKSCKQKGF